MAGSQKETRTAGDETEGQGVPVLRPNVAGIDLASEIHWVCAPNVDGTGREVEKFGATTPELKRMAEWLKQRKVESVAMESTGVYWIAPYEVLGRYEFEILLVDTRELARVPGRKKSDHVDCKCIQRLHSCGLLRARFDRRNRYAGYGLWCGTEGTWWRRQTGCGGCRKAWTRGMYGCTGRSTTLREHGDGHDTSHRKGRETPASWRNCAIRIARRAWNKSPH